MSQQQMKVISLEQAKRVCPIIALMLIIGPLIALVMMLPEGVFEGPVPKQGLNFIGAIVAIAEFTLSLVIPNVLVNSILNKNESTSEKDFYPTAFQLGFIVRFALLESAIYPSIFFMSVENYQSSLGTIAFLLLVMIFNFPTPGRIDAWIKNKKELAGFEQQDADTF